MIKYTPTKGLGIFILTCYLRGLRVYKEVMHMIIVVHMCLCPVYPSRVWAVVWMRLASSALVFGRDQDRHEGLWGCWRKCDSELKGDSGELIRSQGTHRVLWERQSREMLIFTPETSITLPVNYTGIKI